MNKQNNIPFPARRFFTFIILIIVFTSVSSFALEKRDFLGFDSSLDFKFGAQTPPTTAIFGFSTEALRAGLILSWGPGKWFVRFRAGALLLPGLVFGLSAGLALPVWEFYLENGQRLLGLTAFADAGFPFETPFRPDFSGGLLVVMTPNMIGVSVGLRYSTRQGFLPFVAYSGGYLSGKITAKGAEQ